MAGRLDLEINKGATYVKSFIWETKDTGTGVTTPVDLTEFSARMQAREEFDAPTPFLNLNSNPGGGIELAGLPGEIKITILPSVSSALLQEGGVYDLELFHTNNPEYVVRLLEGKIKLRPEVTRVD